MIWKSNLIIYLFKVTVPTIFTSNFLPSFLFQRSIYIPEFPFYSRVFYPSCIVPFLFQSLFFFKVPFHLDGSFPIPGFLSIPSSQLLDTYLHFGDMRSLIFQGSFNILGLIFFTSSFSIQLFFVYSVHFLFKRSYSIPEFRFYSKVPHIIRRIPFLFHGFLLI